MAREESFFDDLARGPASGSISRGKALKLMGAALVGGTLASVGIREAAADNLCKPISAFPELAQEAASTLKIATIFRVYNRRQLSSW